MKEQKKGETRMTCMACNNHFNVQYVGKIDGLQHHKVITVKNVLQKMFSEKKFSSLLSLQVYV